MKVIDHCLWNLIDKTCIVRDVIRYKTDRDVPKTTCIIFKIKNNYIQRTVLLIPTVTLDFVLNDELILSKIT